MNDAFLVGMLDGLAHMREEVEAFPRGQVPFVAVIRDPGPAHEFHDEIRASGGQALTPSPSPIRWARVAGVPLTPSLSPTGGEGVRRTVEGALGNSSIKNPR